MFTGLAIFCFSALVAAGITLAYKRYRLELQVEKLQLTAKALRSESDAMYDTNRQLREYIYEKWSMEKTTVNEIRRLEARNDELQQYINKRDKEGWTL